MTPELLTRAATPADYEDFVRLVPELRVDDPIPTRERWERLLMPGTLMFEEGGKVVAYVYMQVLEGTGYVRNVVVDPSRQGQGVGRAVMEIVAARLREASCSSFCLNVKPDNTPAIRLYERVGMRRSYAMTALRFPWDLVDRFPRAEGSVEAREVAPSDDARIEAAFGLPAGQVAHDRVKGARVQRVVVDSAVGGDAVVGYASFDPEFPGSYPFRVARPALAALLLSALRPHARPEPPYMQVVVEDDDALTELLVATGALVRLRAFHMRGPL